MKTRPFYTIIGLVFAGIILPQACAEEFLYGTSSLERLPSTITPGKPAQFEIKFQYTNGPYALKSLSPVFEVVPESAASQIRFDLEPIQVFKNSVGRIPVTITANKNIEHEKIFLSIYYAGDSLNNVPFKSAWIDSVTINISPKDVIEIPLGDCVPVEIKHTISGGRILTTCKSQDGGSVKAIVDADSEGDVTFDIPKHILYGLASKDCSVDNDFIVLVNREGAKSNITGTENSNLVTVDFESGIHEIEILGVSIMPDPSPIQYCGIVEGYYDRQFVPPRHQIKHGMEPDQIRCNEGLELAIKSSVGSPTCVKPETKQKLVERGWTRTNDMHQNITLTNNFLNIKDRDIRVIVSQTENQDGSLSVRVLEKTTRSEPSDNIMFQKIGYSSMRTMTRNDGFFIVSSTQSDKHLLEKYPAEPTLQTLYVGNIKEQIDVYFPVEIPLDVHAKDEIIIFNYSLPYMLPDFDKTYSFRLASFSSLKIDLPSNAKIIDSETRVHNGFWLFDKNDDGQLSYKTEEYSLFYGYDKPSIPVKSVVIYNIKFEL